MVNLPERDNQPGGALFFKDHLLSPLAIYNNTFWHNFINFAGQCAPGCQHLIFNNIYARPNKFNDSYFAMDKLLPTGCITVSMLLRRRRLRFRIKFSRMGQ